MSERDRALADGINADLAETWTCADQGQALRAVIKHVRRQP